jgi:hypothetical protein
MLTYRSFIAYPFCIFLSLSAASPARAELDAGAKTPYVLRVVLHVADNRLLTPLFQQQLENELRDNLQLTYGPLARVEVVRVHRLLKDIRARGLQALDDWDEVDDIKTHFVLLDYAEGHYRLQARQHDGLSGLASPVIRRDQTAERHLVARTAARLVDRDFGLSATVVGVTGDEVNVVIRGGELGVPLGRWLRPGDVFAVARVTEQGGKRRGARLEATLLRVHGEPQDNTCRCKLFHRRTRDTLRPEPGVLGYRGLSLTTTHGPLRLRLLDERTGKPLNGARVHVSAVGYDPKDPGKDRTTGVDGLIVTPERFDDVAFVRVSTGGKVRARFPVEIVDDRTVVARIDDRGGGGAADELQQRRDHWVRRAEESLELVNSRITDINEALQRSPEAALRAARQAIKGIKEDLDSLNAERAELVKDTSKTGGLDLSEGDRAVQQLGEQTEKLAQFAARQEALIKEAASPERRALEGMLERAQLLEDQADYAQAIRLYETVLAKSKDPVPKLAERLRALKKAWKIPEGDEDHARARDFIYNTWPQLDAAGVKNEVGRALKEFEVCRKRGDRLTPRKLLLTNAAHAANLKKRLEALRFAGDSQDNRAETKALVHAAGELRRLHAAVSKFLRAEKGQERSLNHSPKAFSARLSPIRQPARRLNVCSSPIWKAPWTAPALRPAVYTRSTRAGRCGSATT